jgi:hypothetical protein
MPPKGFSYKNNEGFKMKCLKLYCLQDAESDIYCINHRKEIDKKYGG